MRLVSFFLLLACTHTLAIADEMREVFTADFNYESTITPLARPAKYPPMREPTQHLLFDYTGASMWLLHSNAGGSQNLQPLAQLDQIPIDLQSEAGNIIYSVKGFIQMVMMNGRILGWDYQAIANQRRAIFTSLMIRIIDYLEAQKEGAGGDPALTRDFQIVQSLPNYILLLNPVIQYTERAATENIPWANIDPALIERWRAIQLVGTPQPMKFDASQRQMITQHQFFGEIFVAIEFDAQPSQLNTIRSEMLKSQNVPGRSSGVDGRYHDHTELKNEIIQLLKSRLEATRGGIMFNYRMAVFQCHCAKPTGKMTAIIAAPVYLVQPEMAGQLSADLRSIEQEAAALGSAYGATIRVLYDEYKPGKPTRDAGWSRTVQSLFQRPKQGGAAFDEDF